MYTRIIPRDLFNEAKLLKCLGRLALLVHDGLPLEIDYDPDGFAINQRSSDGGLYVENMTFSAKFPLELYSAYNSKMNYPLLCQAEEEIFVFDEDGNLTEEFKKFINVL
jgi:hypothetical protein